MSHMLCVFFVVQFSQATICWAQSITSILWSEPNGNLSDFSEEFSTGMTLTLAWNSLASSFMINELSNLWITPWDYDAVPASHLITENINLNKSGTYNWTIELPDSMINARTNAQYIFLFMGPSPLMEPGGFEIPSPGVYIFNGQSDAESVASTSSGVSSKIKSTSSGVLSTMNPTLSRSYFITSPTPTSSSSLPPPTSSTKSAVSLSTPTLSPSSPSSMASPPASPPSTKEVKTCDSCGLSRGAIVGIGLGVPCGVLVLAAIVYFIFTWWRKRKRASTELPVLHKSEEKVIPPVTSDQTVAELDGREVGLDMPELSSN